MFDADKPAESIIFTLAATTMTGWENPAPAYACKGFFSIISVKPFVQSFPAFKSDKKVWLFLNNPAKLTPHFTKLFPGSQSICSLFLFLQFPDNSWQTSLHYVNLQSCIAIMSIHLNVRRWKAKGDSFHPAAVFPRECWPSLARDPECHKTFLVKWCDVIEKKNKTLY